MFSNQESVLRDTRDSTIDHYKKINRQLVFILISANTVRKHFKHEPITLALEERKFHITLPMFFLATICCHNRKTE